VFEILLPMADSVVGPVATVDVPAPRERRVHILIVDDDSAIRFALQRSFALRGYDVTLAEDGEEALVELRRPGSEVHVVLTDMRMPRLDGPGLIAAMSEEFPSLPVLGMSGFLHADDHARLSARVSTLIEKPFTLDEVHQAVERALG
jgi:DNA-binding NtrC family response regulator